jgi:tetratricopeptide (TPR) repeat protein
LAVRDYESREDRSPRLWQVHYARGVVLRLLGRPEAALADFQAVAQQDASAELRASALAVIGELGITRVQVFYARTTDKIGAQELATKINDIGKVNVAEVTLSSVPAVAEVRYRLSQQKDMATALATKLNGLLREKYGTAPQLNVRAVDRYPSAGVPLLADTDRTAIDVVLPALTSNANPEPVTATKGKRSYLEIVQQDLSTAARTREWIAVADPSEPHTWVVVASRPTIEQAFDEYQRWKTNAEAKGSPGVELDLHLKYAVNYWYAVAIRANDSDHQQAIIKWAREWEPAAFARQTTFPVEIQPRPLEASRKARITRDHPAP